MGSRRGRRRLERSAQQHDRRNLDRANFLRRFRGVHKKYLVQYVALFEWEHNLEEVTGEFLRMLMDPDFTPDPT